jgi:hypothetical protein
MCGRTDANTKVVGRITRCMVKEFTLGKMVENMKASIIMTKNTGMADIIGLTVGVFKESGLMEKEQETERLRIKKAK